MGSSRLWQMAAAASLVALAVHGTADTGIYASKVLPIMFLPFGFAFAGARAVVAVRHRAERPIARYAAVATAAVVLVLALLPSTRAAFQADLGAVAQTRAELAVYRWPEWPIQDALRRSPEVNLAPAIVRFRASLALDPNNVTANRRLGQIELSRSEYDPAQSHLEAAYAAAPGQRATRQLLGEAYAIAGEVARAADIWRTVDLSDGQLSLRTWWYENNGETENARRITAAGQGAGW
jgi:tetratricopeptide (TPR) repeat protein